MVYGIAHTDSALQRIVDIIVARFHPQRIILFGSRARGDARPGSDYDLAVELPHARDERRSLAASISHAVVSSLGAEVDVIARAPGDIERVMHDVGWIDYDIGREGVVVYPTGGRGHYDTSAPPLRVVRESPVAPPESVSAWLERADDDLLVIAHELREDVVPWSAICFHAQQAAEKYLKVLLIQRHIRPARTHDLTELLRAVRAAGYAVDALDADCAFLREFAVDARYPDAMEMPGQWKGSRAAESVQRIVDAIKPLLLVPQMATAGLSTLEMNHHAPAASMPAGIPNRIQ